MYATPPLSTKPSFSSFRPPLISSLSAPVITTVDAAAALPNLLEPYDSWSDRLGHANYTIMPKPYVPEVADLDSLRLFRADWDQARVNFTKHIVRTGEHYGTTSKTYALTEAKWTETEKEWKVAHDTVMELIAAMGNSDAAELHCMRQQDAAPAAVPRGMLDAEGKFPDLGDVDIVGPMMRDAVMVREHGIEERQNGASRFWKNLAGKVGLRK
ncbi:putative only prolin and serin are matching in the corresponding protein [Phaeoacremonium minimum UCRPA7]|uniref:Putative only prolin and serin are matching in the corresponding protein n=1 Tax=Phaeoacremonium minimum (strain UCR-PA7) TaxID=1286976 RepID=R8B8M3_PHAM7|nr:putative only prolin and serin are matching in the corresponding protein [Phaeoacremonium minimum UCRPA7]EON95659.1 putative only prolin and serin are matching in the corresponding protein [Phaeoacremonium minimum UCRPA7]